MTDHTITFASLAQRVRWAFESLSEVATTLLEVKESDLSAQAFELELACAKLHGKLIERLKDQPPLPIRKEPARRGNEGVPF